jgi:HEAT repeat protein
MGSNIEALIDEAIVEERAESELTDDGHDMPAAEQIGRSPDALPVARRLARSQDAVERSVAAHILGAMVNGHPEHVSDALPVLGELLTGADHPHLEYAVADALRLASDVRAVEPLLQLERSPLEGVRESVAKGLDGAVGHRIAPAAIEALIRLSKDPAAAVRDWATFALGELDDDSEAVRAALWDRVDDPDYDTRCEALAGLARRHDPDVAGRVAAELESDTVGKLVVQAAADLANPAMLEPLQALRSWWDVDPELLARAIEASASGGDQPS